MNKKILIGLLMSITVCEASTPPSPIIKKTDSNASVEDSPMTKLMKNRKTHNVASIAKGMLKKNSELSTKVSSLESDNSELTTKVSSLESNNSKLDIKVSSLETEKSELTTKVSHLEETSKNQQIQILCAKFINKVREEARTKLVELLKNDININTQLENLLNDDAVNAIKQFLNEKNLNKLIGNVEDDNFIFVFNSSRLQAESYYQSKIASLQNYISSNTGLVSATEKQEILAFFANAQSDKSAQDNLEKKILDKLGQKFDECNSVENVFLAAMKTELSDDSQTNSLIDDLL